MGNEAGSKHLKIDENTIREYTRKYREMEDTVSTHNLTIKNLLEEKEKLLETVKRLEQAMAKKDEDTKKRVNDIKSQQKKVHSELSKYKSIPEFEDILSLYTELLEFKNKIDTSLSKVDGNQPSKVEEEIGNLRKKNSELSRQLTSAGGKCTLHEKAGELRAAQNELNSKKERARLEESKIRMKLMLVQDRITQCTAKFAQNMSSAIVDAKEELRKAKHEYSEVENIQKSEDDMMYMKVKSILLEQHTELLREVFLLTAGASAPQKPQQIQNNLRPDKFPEKPMNKYDNLSTCDSDSDDLIDFDDNISECGSLASSENPKPFKLIMHNIPDCGNDTLFVKEVLKPLTDLSLDDIVVRRLGKPGSENTPILVCFDRMNYVHQILKRKHLIKDGAFSKVKINTFRFNKDQNTKGKPDTRGNPNQKQPSKPNQNKNYQKKTNNLANDTNKSTPKQDGTKNVFPF